MQDYGLVSIVMPTWACAGFIGDTIRTVQCQTYTNWELLIQDDCSTDNTKEVVEKLRDESPELGDKIKYECNVHNMGAAITRNNALRRARGRWIAFLDSDDLWLPDKLEKQLCFMVSNGYHFSYTCYSEINESSIDARVIVSGPRHITRLGMYAFCWPGCLTVMYDADKIGLIQIADIKKNNDYAMWLKVVRKSDCYLLDECLAKYRRGRIGSISTHGYRTLIKWHYKLFRESEGMSQFVAFLWTCINLVCGFYKKVVYVRRGI